MEGDSDLVCQFHQYGHCRFGPHCRHFHTKKTCSTPMCNQNSCTERHPKPCFYFSSNHFCKFGISCSFLHQSPAPENCELKNNIVKLKEDLQLVITSLNIKDIEIKKLEEKVTELESQLNNKAFSVQSSFKCDIYDYSCSSETVLKRHKSTKHRKETLREENICETSLKISPVKGERNHELNKFHPSLWRARSIFSNQSFSNWQQPQPQGCCRHKMWPMWLRFFQWPRCIGVSQELGTSWSKAYL